MKKKIVCEWGSGVGIFIKYRFC